MTIWLISLLINCSLGFMIVALTVLLLAMALVQVRKVVYLALVDVIELRTRWQQSGIDLNNNRVLVELNHKSLVLDLQHRGKMLEVESDQAQMGIRTQRLELLASLDEGAK